MNQFNDFIAKNGFRKTFVAEKLGIHYQYLLLLLHGRRKASVKIAKKIEKFTEGKIKFFEFFEELDTAKEERPSCGPDAKENFKEKESQ